MESHSQPLSNEDLLALEEQRKEEDVLEEVASGDPKGLTSRILSEVSRYFEAGMALLEKHDDF